MTVPRWVDPDPDPREDPDDGGDHPGHEPSEAPSPAVSGLDELAEKPVLEWTNEDWALWIDSADGSPLPTSPPAGGAPEGEPAAGGEPDGEPATDAGPHETPEPGDGMAAGEGPTDGDPRPPDTDDDVEPADHGPGIGDSAETGAWVIPPADVTTAPDDRDWAAGQSGGETEAEVAATEPESWPLTAEAVPAEATAEPADILVTDEATESEPVTAEAADEAADEDEWAGVADHPWWESAPAVDEADVLDTDPPTTVEPVVEVGPPVEVTPPQPYPSPPVYSSPRATRPMPAPRTEQALPRPPMAAPVRSHRVRSAFGLLGVAVMVGMVVAGLITVAIFAISVALRHAVG